MTEAACRPLDERQGERQGRCFEFRTHLPVRPGTIRADTDLQVEALDRAGGRHRLPQVWLRWRRPGETLRELLPQTAELGPYIVHPAHEDNGPIRPMAP